MTKQQLYGELETILETPPGSLTGDERLKEFEQWDSLGALSFIAMADATFGYLISGAELAECQTVEDIIRLFPGKITDQETTP